MHKAHIVRLLLSCPSLIQIVLLWRLQVSNHYGLQSLLFDIKHCATQKLCWVPGIHACALGGSHAILHINPTAPWRSLIPWIAIKWAGLCRMLACMSCQLWSALQVWANGSSIGKAQPSQALYQFINISKYAIYYYYTYLCVEICYLSTSKWCAVVVLTGKRTLAFKVKWVSKNWFWLMPKFSQEQQ